MVDQKRGSPRAGRMSGVRSAFHTECVWRSLVILRTARLPNMEIKLRERDRETESERDRQTDRQTDRERASERERDRERERERERERGRATHTHTHIHTHAHGVRNPLQTLLPTVHSENTSAAAWFHWMRHATHVVTLETSTRAASLRQRNAGRLQREPGVVDAAPPRPVNPKPRLALNAQCATREVRTSGDVPIETYPFRRVGSSRNRIKS